MSEDTSSVSTFAEASSALPDGGASVVAELSTSARTPAPASTSTPEAGAVRRSSIPLDAAGRGPAATAPALNSGPSGEAGVSSGDLFAPNATDPTSAPDAADPTAAPSFAPEVLAAARQHLEADPTVRPFLELRNQFTDGDLREVMPRLQRLVADPVGFYRDLGAELRSHGLVDGGASDEPFSMPDPDLSNEDGSQTAYSAQAVQQIVNGLIGMVRPLVEERQQTQAERQAQTQHQQRVEGFTRQIQRFEAQYPDFKELKPQIATLIRDDFRKPKHLREFDGNFQAAYLHLRQSQQPKIEERARQTVVADLNRKAGAGTMRPQSRVSGGGPRPAPRKFSEVAESNPAAAHAALASLGVL